VPVAKGGVAVLEYYEAQQRIRRLAEPPTHIAADPEIFGKLARLRLDFAGLRLALRKFRVEDATGESGHRVYRGVGPIDDMEVGAEVAIVQRGELGECLSLTDVWKA
jgi:hypothetical protein